MILHLVYRVIANREKKTLKLKQKDVKSDVAAFLIIYLLYSYPFTPLAHCLQREVRLTSELFKVFVLESRTFGVGNATIAPWV